MHTLRKALVASAALALIVTTEASAQRRPSATTATRAGSQPAQGTSGGPSTGWTLYGGIATGDNLDMGFAIQGSYRFTPAGWPLSLRIDPYFARHGGDEDFVSDVVDVTFMLLGAGVNGEFTFPTDNATVEPFVLGGLGVYYGKTTVDSDFPGIGDIEGSDTELGITLGGGIRFARRWVAEAQFKMIDEFDTIPLLIGFRF
jgi:hypothetical protein